MQEIAVVKIVSSKDDFLKSIEIRKKVFVDEQNVPLDMEVDEYEDQSTHFLIYFEQKAVGTGRCRLMGSFLKIERLSILKEFRGKHLGAELLKFIQEEAFQKHPTYLQVMHAQAYALKFYEKLGWVKIGDIFDEAGIDHYLMINFIKDKDFVKNLKCLEDPKCREDIKKYLLDFLKS